MACSDSTTTSAMTPPTSTLGALLTTPISQVGLPPPSSGTFVESSSGSSASIISTVAPPTTVSNSGESGVNASTGISVASEEDEGVASQTVTLAPGPAATWGHHVLASAMQGPLMETPQLETITLDSLQTTQVLNLLSGQVEGGVLNQEPGAAPIIILQADEQLTLQEVTSIDGGNLIGENTQYLMPLGGTAAQDVVLLTNIDQSQFVSTEGDTSTEPLVISLDSLISQQGTVNTPSDMGQGGSANNQNIVIQTLTDNSAQPTRLVNQPIETVAGQSQESCEPGKGTCTEQSSSPHLLQVKMDDGSLRNVCMKHVKAVSVSNATLLKGAPQGTDSNAAPPAVAELSAGKKLFKCELCSATFDRMGNYTRHTMIHTVHTKEDYRYKCDECGRFFLQRCDLKRHMQVHQGTQPFKCTVCDKGYVRQSDLKVHMRFHNQERPHKCPHCSHAFFQSGDMKRHVRLVHLKSKLLTCGHCSKKYSKEMTLIRHMQSMHRDIILKSLNQQLSTGNSEKSSSPEATAANTEAVVKK